MKQRNVLIFPAGTEVGLEIYNALRYCKEIRLFGAGQNISNHARFVFQEYHHLPSIHERNWLTSIINLCGELDIHYIFPAHDDVIVALSRAASLIPAAILTSPKHTCEITRSKSKTYRYLGNKVRVPILYDSGDIVESYPVFVKPDRGQGSFGAFKVDSSEYLATALASVEDPIICEYISGGEYTVDCFSDRENGLLFVGARSRRRVRNGISVNTITENLPEAYDIAVAISQELEFHGAWFFQLKRACDGQLVLLEIAPRIAGSMAAHRVAGINLSLLSIFEHERMPLTLHLNLGQIELDRSLCNRYRHAITYSTLYLDLDDTLICSGHVNIQIIKLIFQCINQGKRIVLLTRHASDLVNTLAAHRLSGLFDKIIHLKIGEPKSMYILESDAILVDDSFSERMEVAASRGIPTFDCSMVEMLTEQAESLNGGGNVRKT